MTQHSDQLRLGAAYYEAQARWNGGGMAGLPLATAPQDTQVLGVPFTQQFYYQVGTASTALASGIWYSASGTTATTGVLTPTGALVSAGVATFDVPRGIRWTTSSGASLATTTLTVVGTDGYGKTQTHAFLGPTGDIAGNLGSYTDSLVTFKTVTSISFSITATGIGTTAMQIGNNNCFGLPYVLNNAGGGLGTYINGAQITGTLPTIAPVFTAAYTPTGTPTASTGDVRGTCALATAVLANGSRYITIGMIAPPVNLSVATDDKVHTYGATPYTT